ncbi:MAG: 30S ribosomal protein S2 [Candidatus Marinimicrobia bacterium]|jgi:small subunit ribosomal protein S2|nr:30S ribosomal protein S2 [Candidatus Neomarinimicrobiota bacterium]MBT4154218.1 30S ribosomal protein S2 [Candidatus Neomarinimicrobiota bacterium]MBT4554147.1 30S ribosomal protein S2 [Candidatus Neomarinimicrobiota bacterium]MBT6413981.1 30S ribosomal protein S2 [Candidatus Neomarinimicrobiota bacterium]MBT6796770.1 30S ribosomal protein S2 [Candidatus Neomarinimicrobiota bacterium]|tara:strand:+ start:5085 stop:5969 length:885 start_codon:yes stop_codon:yes gene_type:complete
MAEVKFEDLLGTGAHFGHVTRKWNPSFKPYILLEKNGIHIINLESTIEAITKAGNFVKDIVSKKGEILFVGTKKQAQDIIQQEADRCSMFYIVERWLGGTLTNFSTIKKSIKRLKMLEKEGSSLYENLTKKETQMLNREKVKLADQHRGIKDMRRLPDAIIIVDAQYEDTAIREAKRLDIPVIAIVDSNTDPNKVDIPIPANDDSIRTIQLIISALADAVNEARESVADKDNKKENKKVEVNKTESAVELKDSTKESSPKNGAETAPIIEAVVEDSPDKKESKEVDESPGKDEK